MECIVIDVFGVILLRVSVIFYYMSINISIRITIVIITLGLILPLTLDKFVK